jgi:anti-anti-sigma factor
MTLLARVEDEWHDDVPVARLHGEIDASNVDDIGARLRSLVSNRSTGLVVDLAGVSYVDSAGINLMFALGEEMRGHQQRLAMIVRDGSPIARMITLTGLDSAVPTRATLEEALGAARGDA